MQERVTRLAHNNKLNTTHTVQFIQYNRDMTTACRQFQQALQCHLKSRPSLKSGNIGQVEGQRENKEVMWRIKLEVNVTDGGECLFVERKLSF